MDLCNQLRIDSASEMDEYSVYALNDKGESALCAEVCCVCIHTTAAENLPARNLGHWSV